MTKDVQTYLKAQVAQLKNEVTSSEASIRVHENEIISAQKRISDFKALIDQQRAVIAALEKLVKGEDNRPKGWNINGYAFFIPSKSRRGKGHEICGAYRYSSSGLYPAAERYEWSCNCESGRYRKSCWALTEVKNYISYYSPLPVGSKRMWPKGVALASNTYGDDFGLIDWND